MKCERSQAEIPFFFKYLKRERPPSNSTHNDGPIRNGNKIQPLLACGIAALPTFFVVLLATFTLPMPRPAGAAISMAAWAWVFQYGVGMPANATKAGADWYFDFPADCAIDPSLGYKPRSVNYLITASSGAIAYGKTKQPDILHEVTQRPPVGS